MKILIIALSGIGDALMFTPSLNMLKKTVPEAEINALVMIPGAADLLKNNPHVENVFYFDFLNEGAVKSLKYLLKLRGKYDASISVYPSNRKEYNIINRLIRANSRCAVKYLRGDFNNFGFLNNIRIKESGETHNALTNLRMCEALLNKKSNELPPLEIYFRNEDTSYAELFFENNNISKNDIVVGFHPGCATLKNHIKRRWESNKFIALGKKLIKEHSAKILIFGGPDEMELKENISAEIKSPDSIVINTETILQSSAIMKRCNVFVTNDSSQMHIAAALQLKVVAIIGPTNSKYIYPWQTEHKIVTLNLECSPCFFYSPRPLICSRDDVKFKCIKELDVYMVYEEVINYL